MSASAEWAEQLAGWAIPQQILDAAPADPYVFPVRAISTTTVDPRDTPTGTAVLQRLSPGGRLLDVGCGAGRISKVFTADHEVVGVEPRPTLAAAARDVGIEVIEGRWPELAGQIGRAQVVLSTHVLYDVADAGPFLQALHGAGERRVVLEITDDHPWAATRPLFQHFHDLPRPPGPTADLLARVVEQVLEITPEAARWSRPRVRYDVMGDLVAGYRRMLCLPPERDAEVAEQLAAQVITDDDSGEVAMPDQGLTTLWWDT